MNEIARDILNALIHKYENSKSSTGDNQVQQSFYLTIFSKKKSRDRVGQDIFKEYIDAYGDFSYKQECNETFKRLEKKGYCQFLYQGEVCEKIILNNDKIPEIYAELGRIPSSEIEKRSIEFLENERSLSEKAPLTLSFIDMLLERLHAHQSCKKYFESADEWASVFITSRAIEMNQEEIYLRNFSKHVLKDSKAIERLATKLLTIFNAASHRYENFDELLLDYRILSVRTPTLVKGPIVIEVEGVRFDIGSLNGEFALSSSVLHQMKILEMNVSKVITIENQTTFYDYQDPDALIIYLGGYASGDRIELLKLLHASFPDISFYHFGDIDWGGFRIFMHLVRVSGIPFEPLFMDIETLESCRKEWIELTADEIKRLNALLEGETHPFKPVISYMVEHRVKLEQESLSALN